MKSSKRYGSYIARSAICVFMCCFILFTTLSDKVKIGERLSPYALAVVGVFSPVEYADAVYNAMASDKAVTDKKPIMLSTLFGFGAGRRDSDTLAYVSDDIEAMIASYEDKYADYEKTGDILEEDLSGKKVSSVFKSVSVYDSCDAANADIESDLAAKLNLGDFNKYKPCILIYHTHTTEGYEILDKGWYSDDYNSRTEDSSRNIVRVGDEITDRLTKAGYTVIHDTTVHDTSYSGSYDRSAVTVKKWLEEYPSIILSIDVHRDAIHYDGTIKSKPTAVIDGKKAAQVMIISGCESGDVTDFPNWKDNLTFSVKLQEKAQELHPGIMRPIMFCERKYNMNLTRYAMLLEFGTDANTLDEAVYSGRLIGDSLAEMLDSELKNQ